MRLGRKPQGTDEEATETPVTKENIAAMLKVPQAAIPEGYVEVSRYPLKPPFSYAVVAQKQETLEYLYLIDELPLEPEEFKVYKQLREAMELELKAPADIKQFGESFREQLPEIIERRKDIFTPISKVSMQKVLYYLERDIVGYSLLDPVIQDPAVEDISCSGSNKPIFIWHKEFESVKTNISFKSDEELDDYIVKQVHRAGKHVSTAYPVADVTLPGKHRLAVLYRKEVTPMGTNFTIRKFRHDPYTVIDLIRTGTMDEKIAAYFWMLLENKQSFMILGATGAGKTTTLNAILCFVPPSMKIFTIEEVAELNLPHENWFTLVSRVGFGLEGEGQINLYDLMKSAVRHRPDLIVVGEVRGEEAYVLFQALATGHGGLCTMHADSVSSAIKRLTQKPLDIPSASIPLMKCVIVVKRVKARSEPLGPSSLRIRLTEVSEILDPDKVRDIFTWNPVGDDFDGDLVTSKLLRNLAENQGLSYEEILKETERRMVILRWMTDLNIREYRTVNGVFASYLHDPASVYEKARRMTQ